MFRMRRRLALPVLLAACNAVVLPAGPQPPEQSPLAGTWVANLAKSTRHSNHQFKSATLTVVVAGNTVTVTHQGVTAAGKEQSGTVVLHADGQEHQVPDQPGITVVTRWVGPRVLQTIGKNAGKQAGEQTYEVSADGKTLTATVAGIDASRRPFQQVIVFDRQ